MAAALPSLLNLTSLLRQIGSHDRGAASSALELAYDYLRDVAMAVLRGEFRRSNVSAETLVHEVYLHHLCDRRIPIRNRGDFPGLVRIFMRRVMLDHIRASKALKRGRDAIQVPLQGQERIGADEMDVEQSSALNRALDRLRKLDPKAARVVELRYLFGYTNEGTAQRLGLEIRKVRDDWDFAKVWLLDQLGHKPDARW